jgi:nicotinamidase-related amidase
MVYCVDATAFDEEAKGYRVSIVIEGEHGHRPTGDDNYKTSVRARRPYFWGPTLEAAEDAAEFQNARMGISKTEAFKIIGASMFPHGKRARKS